MSVTPRNNAGHDQNRTPTLIGVSTADGFTPVSVEVDPATGQIQVSSGPMGLPGSYDAVVYTNTSTTVDTYQYKSGGTSGTIVATVTITYTDTTKAQISTVVRT